MADEQQREGPMIAMSDHEELCLRAAYSDLFGQEYTLSQVSASPVEPSWAVQ